MTRIKLELNKEEFKKKLDIKDGKTPTKKELVEIIKPLIPEPKKEVIIEKTEVIKEQPIINNIESKETGKSIVEKINELRTDTNEFKIDASHIKNIPNTQTLLQRITSAEWGSINGNISDQTDLINLLYGYVTDTELTTILSNYVTNSSLATTLLGYVPFTGASKNVDLNNKAIANTSSVSIGTATIDPTILLLISKDQSATTQFRIFNPNTAGSNLASASFILGRDLTDFATQVYKDNFGSDTTLIQKKKSYIIRTSSTSTGGLILISGGGNIIFGTGGTALTNQRATITGTGMAINGNRPVISTPTAILDIAGSINPTLPSFRIREGGYSIDVATPLQGAFINDSQNLYMGLTNPYSGNTEWTQVTRQSSSYGVVGALPNFIDNGNGTITIESGLFSVLLGADTNGSVSPQLYLIDSQAVMGAVTTLTDGVFNYIVANFNEGNPIIEVITDVTLIDEATIVPIYSIYRNGNYLHTQPWGQTYLQGNWGGLGGTLANKIHQSIVKTQRYRREFGLSISEYGTRNVRVTAGKIYQGAVPINLDEVASATDNIFFWYHNAGNWTQSVVTQYNNTQYDNGTNLATLTPNRYAVNFVYRGIENQKHLYIVLGTGDYTLAQAQSAQPPAIPSVISSHATLVGKIIVQNGSNTAYSVQSAFDVQFSASGVTSHPDLTNLSWNTSGHTGNANSYAGFDNSGNATQYKISSKRVSSVVSSATPSINADTTDAYKITALTTNITSFSITGTPTDFQELVIRIKDDGTARTIAWGTSFEPKGVSLPTSTVANKTLTVKFIYDSVTSKFGCIYSIQEA